ncbi:hypothetical protein PGB90_004501 [Kerria lacca]
MEESNDKISMDFEDLLKIDNENNTTYEQYNSLEFFWKDVNNLFEQHLAPNTLPTLVNENTQVKEISEVFNQNVIEEASISLNSNTILKNTSCLNEDVKNVDVTKNKSLPELITNKGYEDKLQKWRSEKCSPKKKKKYSSNIINFIEGNTVKSANNIKKTIINKNITNTLPSITKSRIRSDASNEIEILNMKSNIERIKLQKCCVLLPKINVKNYFEKSDSIQSNVPEKSSTNTFLKKGLQNEIENIFTFPVPQKKIPLVTEKMDIVRKYCDSSTSRNTNTKKTQTDVKKSFFHTMVDENFKEILKKEITEVIKLILSNEALSFKSVIKIDDNFISKIVEKMLNETIFKSNVSESNEKTILKCHNCFIMNEDEDNSIVQKIILEIQQLTAFCIKWKYVTMKILTNLEKFVRQLQALTMIQYIPLAHKIVEFYNGEVTHEVDINQCEVTLYKQEEVVHTCVHDILQTNKPVLKIIDGVTGTGKSEILVNLINELFKTEHVSSHNLKILVVTNTDNAANDICQRLNERYSGKTKLSILKYDTIENIDPSLNDFTLKIKMQNFMAKEEKTFIDVTLEKEILKSKINSLKLEINDQKRKKETMLEEKHTRLENLLRTIGDMNAHNQELINQLKSSYAKETVIAYSDVVVTSLDNCWCNDFEKDFVFCSSDIFRANGGNYHKFSVCIIDDAEKVKNIDLMIPVVIMAQKLILIGDSRSQIMKHKIISSKIVKKMNDIPPFNRLVANIPASIVIKMKRENRRMHPKILLWFQDYFNLNCISFSLHDEFLLKPLMVIDMMNEDEYKCILEKKFHEKSILFCSNIIQNIINLELDDSIKIGILVEDKKQRTEMKKLFSDEKKILIGNSNQFIGIEKEIIIIFCLPLLWDSLLDKWLYIALSRAKNSLIICDNFSKIKGRKAIDSLIKYAKIRKSYFSWRLNTEVKDFPPSHIISYNKSHIKNESSNAESNIKGMAKLPCNKIYFSNSGYNARRPTLIMWFKYGIASPIYSVDFRHIKDGSHWSADEVLGSRAYFNIDEAVLSIEQVKQTDAGLYKCRIDFEKYPTKNYIVNLSIVG